MNLTPNNNTELHGHKIAFSNLVKLYLESNLPNKIIISGKKGIGKSTFAYHLINYIFSINDKEKYNIQNNRINENNNNYKLVSKNSHPNFFLISNDDKSNIHISKIREMINFTNKSSFNNSCRIVLIDNIEHLNIFSVNALLKVIEEPNDNLYFFLIHNSNSRILDTLNSRCIKFNLFLNDIDKSKALDNLLKNDFYSNLSDDFKNVYNSPGDIISLYNFFLENNIDAGIKIEDLFKLIINKKIYKINLFVKDNLSYFIELYFKKKITLYSAKKVYYYLYKYFLLKISNCKKYNLDFESILIEFDNKVLNE